MFCTEKTNIIIITHEKPSCMSRDVIPAEAGIQSLKSLDILNLKNQKLDFPTCPEFPLPQE